MLGSIRANKCRELEVNEEKGWSGERVDFLHAVPQLEALTLVASTLPSDEAVSTLADLKYLDLKTLCSNRLDLSKLQKLEWLGINWRAKIIGLFDLAALRNLFVDGFRGPALPSMQGLRCLEGLDLWNSTVSNIDALAELKTLEELRLGKLRKLDSLSAIGNVHRLKELTINACTQIDSLNGLENLLSLRSLTIMNCGEIESLKPIEPLKALETVRLYESTNIVDGDLSPLRTLPQLKKIAFTNRAHYSERRESFSQR